MSYLPQVQDILGTVTLYRRKGDAARQRGREDTAREAWLAGLKTSGEAFTALDIPPAVSTAQAEAYGGDVATVAAELLGVRGGLLRRLGKVDDALESYRTGAVWEASHHLSQTYNRMNAFKLALIAGDQTLAQLHKPLSEFRDELEKRLSTDERATDDAWLWADLGDVCLLLGDEAGAVPAYRDFVTRARSDSPVAALTVLNEVVEALYAHKDPGAARTARALDEVKKAIGAS